MLFIETRGNDKIKPKEVNFSYAILNPMASFGGLYVPKELPKLDYFLQINKDSNYKELALNLLKKFEIDIDDITLQEALNLYEHFDGKCPAPVKKIKDDLFVQELYHGPTRAFKDMALQPFGYILSSLAQKLQKKYLILAATSGDTGPATLETFKNRANIKVACLYPDGGTSDVQRLQMVTEEADNLKVIGIKGNFDDAQNALKKLLDSKNFKKELDSCGYQLSAANSVNFGRIIFQIIYHIHSYLVLVRQNEIKYGEKIYLIIPSGNFGNALGAYYAKKMGLPIEKILIASNENNILTDLVNSGKYDLRERELIMTKSPAMDILKSSNVERILFDKFGSDRAKELMDSLNNKNYYELTKSELELLREDFDAIYSDDFYGEAKIKEYLLEDDYLVDPHTATCFKAYENLKTKPLKSVISSTAEWSKFSPTVIKALSGEELSDEEALKKITDDFNVKLVKSVKNLFTKPIVHKDIVNRDEIEKSIVKFIHS